MLECFSIEETKKIIENEDNMTGLHRLFTIFLYAEIVKEWENSFSPIKGNVPKRRFETGS
ncbi:MAG: hypothetical protein PHW46_05530, partial [Candidatus Omnitrophica bacterium]|nr:hypothetical protein [Candidatus Omnitrophota bacterium]